MIDIKPLQSRLNALSSLLDERAYRLVVAAEVLAIGRGGMAAVSHAARVSRGAIARGLKELRDPRQSCGAGIRRRGGGRKRLAEKDATLRSDLERLVDPSSRGDPMSPLRWTCKSTRKLAEELRRLGHQISHPVVADLLHELGYSLQANEKTVEGHQQPDRDAQFEHISARASEYMQNGQPVISVDTKKKELVGNFKNNGREWQPQDCPEKVQVHDFVDRELGKAIPYGVYDLNQNSGWVNVGVDHDTSAFAVASISRWWECMGRGTYPHAKQLLITADSGGSNGARVHLWKAELQKLANTTGLEIAVCHFPSGTSKWNKIEHRLFSFITQNWRGKPLVNHEVIVNLIAATTTAKGLHVRSAIDRNSYPPGIKVPKQQIAALNIRRDVFHGEWNYSILPQPVNVT